MKKILQSWCIICEMDVGYNSTGDSINSKNNSSFVTFVKLWPLFCKYFKLNGEKYEDVYKFHCEMKPFVSPFCGMCSREVSLLLTLHEQLQSTMEKIQNSMKKISTTVRQSIADRTAADADADDCSQVQVQDEEEEREIKRDDFIMSQIENLREWIIQGYKLKVVMVHGDGSSEKEQAETISSESSEAQVLMEEEKVSKGKSPAIEKIHVFAEENDAEAERQRQDGSLIWKSKLKANSTSKDAKQQQQPLKITRDKNQQPKNPSFICDICSEKFSTRNLLLTHRQTHNWSLIQQFNPKRIIPKLGSPGTFIVPGAGELKQIEREYRGKVATESRLAFQCCSCQLVEESIGRMIIHVREFHPHPPPHLNPAQNSSVNATTLTRINLPLPKPELMSARTKPLRLAPPEQPEPESAQLGPPVKRARITQNTNTKTKAQRGKKSSSPWSLTVKAASTSGSYTPSPLNSGSGSSTSSSSINDEITQEGEREERTQVQVITISDSPVSEVEPEAEWNIEADESSNQGTSPCQTQSQAQSILFIHGRWLYAQLEEDENILKCVECGRMERSHDEIIHHIQCTHETAEG